MYFEDGIEEKDIVILDVIEWEGDVVKVEGVIYEFSVLVDCLEDEVKDVVLKLKLGDQIKINFF